MASGLLTARLAIFVALLAQLQLALASFYTVTSYYLLTTTTSTLTEYCETTGSCDVWTDTAASLTVNPTVTPTAKPISTSTYSDTYDDVEIVSIFLAPGAVPASDLVTATRTSSASRSVYTEYAVPVTWTAPASCPTPFTVTTFAEVYVPAVITAHLSPQSTTSTVYTDHLSSSTYTYLTLFLAPTAVPSSVLGDTTTDYDYTAYVARCTNPATWDDSSSSSGSGGSGGYHSGDDSGGDGSDDWTVCAALTGCVSLATWIIVVASVLPSIFLLGFVESYFWFRRLMRGQSALRLGTICWSALSLWCLCVIRRSPERSSEDQVLLRQYWASLGAGTRIKLWLRHGFRWRYPVELLGNPSGGNPAVVMPVPPPPPGQAQGVADEKGQVQPVYAAVPVPGQMYVQPYPGAPGSQPPQGYAMPGAPQAVYMMPQPGVAPGQGVGDGQAQGYPQQQGQQPFQPAHVPSPSPVQSTATAPPSMQPTPPPPHEQYQPPPGNPPQQQPPH
jgi:hypothetical protein